MALKDKGSGVRTTVYGCGGRWGVHRSWEKFPLAVDYIGFEPELGGFTDLAEIAPRYKPQDNLNFSAEQLALSDKKGKAAFSVYTIPGTSSFFDIEPSGCHRYRNRDLKVVRRVPVECDTLDRISKRRVERPDFLVLDTQGSELMIFKGAKNILKDSVIGIRCEVGFISYYPKAPLFDEIFQYLAKNGFKLVRLERCGSELSGASTDGGPFSLSWDDAAPFAADAIFVREDDFLEKAKGRDAAEKFLKYFYFTLANSSGSLGMDLMWRLIAKGRLKAILAALTDAEFRGIHAAATSYLDRVEQVKWQTDENYLSWYRRDRKSLRAELFAAAASRSPRAAAV